MELALSELWDLLLLWDSCSLYHLGIVMEKIPSILKYTGTHHDKSRDGANGDLCSFPVCLLLPGWRQIGGGCEGNRSSSASAVILVCFLGLHRPRSWKCDLFFSILEMGSRKLPIATWVGRAGGGLHCRYCEVCRFHSVGICHLANSQVSAIPVRVSCSLHGQST